jgi:hypothetical protein
MAEPKTRPTDASVADFLAAVPNAVRRADAAVVDAMLREATGEPPVLWGPSIVGYGEVSAAGSGGKETTWPVIAFSPRKTELVLYLDTRVEQALLDEVGPHRRGASCVYLKRLAGLDEAALRRAIARSVELATSAAAALR